MSAFPTFDVDASDEMVARHICTYIFQLLSGILTLDALAARVILRWLPIFCEFNEVGKA